MQTLLMILTLSAATAQADGAQADGNLDSRPESSEQDDTIRLAQAESEAQAKEQAAEIKRAAQKKSTEPKPAVKETNSRIGGFGGGVQTTFIPGGGLLGPEAGISGVYDHLKWRVSALLNVIFVEDVEVAFGFGGRFFYVLHAMQWADFSVGAGLGFQYYDNTSSSNDSIVGGYLEGLAQIRVFVVRNVSINATGGVLLRVGDGPTAFALTGQAQGAFGLTYFFE